MFTDIDQNTLDIEWFLTNGPEVAFMTSAGSMLPTSVAKSASNNKLLREYFRSLPFIGTPVINPFLNAVLGHRIDDVSYSDFLNMARRGLYAFDKSNLGAFNDPNYYLVARPEIPLKTNTLPLEIISTLTATGFSGAFGLTFDIKDLF